MSTHLDDRSNPGDGAEAGSTGVDGVDSGIDHGADAGPIASDTVATVDHDPLLPADEGPWDLPPAAPGRPPMPTQGTLSRFGDALVAPFFRRRRETVVLVSLVILAVLVWVAVTQLNLPPGAGQSVIS